jgi:hypothetical protein
MKKVTKYQTDDGQTFNSEFDAKSHEWFLTFRGLIQRNTKGTVNFNVADAANAMKLDPELFRDELNKYIDFKRRNAKVKQT